MKKTFIAAAAMLAISAISSSFVMASETTDEAAPSGFSENGPDFSSLTVEDWMNYEFNKDYSTVFSDITSYAHEDSRELLDVHWSSYLGIMPFLMDPEGEMTEEQCREILESWDNARSSITPLSDPEEARIYLYEADNVPTSTEYTDNSAYTYADEPGYVPYMLECLLEEGQEAKGAVLLCAGGAHLYRSNVEEAYESALALNQKGYQCFIVNYRVNPYSDEESALDLARAVRYVRAHAEEYGIQEDQIATAGFSYGGIIASLQADDFFGDVNGTIIDASYTPDELDEVSADVNCYIGIYSVTYHDSVDEITNENFPATFIVYGSADESLWNWGFTSFQAIKDKGIPCELHTFSGVPHGFGAGTHADGTYYENAAQWPSLADVFMQNVYNGIEVRKNLEEVTEETAEETTQD